MTSSTQPAPEQHSVNSMPKGYNTVTPYITARQASEMLEFVKKALARSNECVPRGEAEACTPKCGLGIRY